MDPDGDQVRYGWDWNGDGVVDEWSGFGSSGWTDSRSHSWSSLGTYYVKVYAQDSHYASSGWSSSLTVTISNRAPNTPSTPSGTIDGYENFFYSYSTSATDPDGDKVQYRFDWGDGSVSDWTGLVSSGSSANAYHSWSSGVYYVEAQAKDEHGAVSLWSNNLKVIISNDEDSHNNEVSVYAIGHYLTYGDLPNAIADAQGFLSIMQYTSIIPIPPQYNENVTEEKFMDPSLVGDRGQDYLWVDNVDFVYYSGHSDEGGLKLYRYDEREDPIARPDYVQYNEVKWGDKDLEWMALSSCCVLQESTYPQWFPALDDKLHGICGFDSEATDVYNLGYWFAVYMAEGSYRYSIGRSWQEATIATETGRTAAILYGQSADISFYDEPFPVGGSPTFPDPNYENSGYWELRYDHWRC